MRKEVQTEREQLVSETDKEKLEIRRQWQKLQDEIKRMEEIHNLQQVTSEVGIIHNYNANYNFVKCEKKYNGLQCA